MGQDARLADGAGDGSLALADGGPLAPDVGDPDGAAPFFPSDFTLPDLNPVSTTHRMDVSPRAMRGRITAWYFGTST